MPSAVEKNTYKQVVSLDAYLDEDVGFLSTTPMDLGPGPSQLFRGSNGYQLVDVNENDGTRVGGIRPWRKSMLAAVSLLAIGIVMVVYQWHFDAVPVAKSAAVKEQKFGISPCGTVANAASPCAILPPTICDKYNGVYYDSTKSCCPKEPICGSRYCGAVDCQVKNVSACCTKSFKDLCGHNGAMAPCRIPKIYTGTMTTQMSGSIRSLTYDIRTAIAQLLQLPATNIDVSRSTSQGRRLLENVKFKYEVRVNQDSALHPEDIKNRLNVSRLGWIVRQTVNQNQPGSVFEVLDVSKPSLYRAWIPTTTPTTTTIISGVYKSISLDPVLKAIKDKGDDIVTHVDDHSEVLGRKVDILRTKVHEIALSHTNYRCKCEHGYPAVGQLCPAEGLEYCTTCVFGYLPHTSKCNQTKTLMCEKRCVKNKCKCQHGDPTEFCESSDWDSCRRCHGNFTPFAVHDALMCLPPKRDGLDSLYPQIRLIKNQLDNITNDTRKIKKGQDDWKSEILNTFLSNCGPSAAASTTAPPIAPTTAPSMAQISNTVLGDGAHITSTVNNVVNNKCVIKIDKDNTINSQKVPKAFADKIRKEEKTPWDFIKKNLEILASSGGTFPQVIGRVTLNMIVSQQQLIALENDISAALTEEFGAESRKLGIPIQNITASLVTQTLKAACMWRQTSGCSPTGTREPAKDKSCSATIPTDKSGYCDCDGDGQMNNGDQGFNCTTTPGFCYSICQVAEPSPEAEPQPMTEVFEIGSMVVSHGVVYGIVAPPSQQTQEYKLYNTKEKCEGTLQQKDKALMNRIVEFHHGAAYWTGKVVAEDLVGVNMTNARRPLKFENVSHLDQAYACENTTGWIKADGSIAESAEGCNICVAQDFRSSNTTCAACHDGYYLSGLTCEAFQCDNTTGWRTDNGSIKGSGAGCKTCVHPMNRTSNTTCDGCHAGYYNSNGTCKAYTCTTGANEGCATCVALPYRTTNAHCDKCNPGYERKGTNCQAHTCKKGPKEGCKTCVALPLRTTNAHCDKCNPGYERKGTNCQAHCIKPSTKGYDLTDCAPTIVQAGWNLTCGSCSVGYKGAVSHTVCGSAGAVWSVSGCQATPMPVAAIATNATEANGTTNATEATPMSVATNATEANGTTNATEATPTAVVKIRKLAEANRTTNATEANRSANAIEACGADCQACIDATNCTRCLHSKYLSNGDCVTGCPDGYFGIGSDVAGRTCKACGADCQACTDATNCTTCLHNKYLSDGDCVTGCPDGYFGIGSDVAGRTCKACGADCQACIDATNCTRCLHSKYLSNGDCVTGCPDGYFGIGSDVAGRTCKAYGCTTSAEGNGCKTCVTQALRKTDHFCASCHDGYLLSNGTCQDFVFNGGWVDLEDANDQRTNDTAIVAHADMVQVELLHVVLQKGLFDYATVEESCSDTLGDGSPKYKDIDGDDCTQYEPSWCGGEYDTASFKASQFCCVCGGGNGQALFKNDNVKERTSHAHSYLRGGIGLITEVLNSRKVMVQAHGDSEARKLDYKDLQRVDSFHRGNEIKIKHYKMYDQSLESKKGTIKQINTDENETKYIVEMDEKVLVVVPRRIVAEGIRSEKGDEVTCDDKVNLAVADGLGEAASQAYHYCVKIVTSSIEPHADGTLDVSIMQLGVTRQVALGSFTIGEVVLEECYPSPVLPVQVKNPSTNAWIGSISYSENGAAYQYMACNDCTGTTASADLVIVDGDDNGRASYTTRCTNGATCNFGVLASQSCSDYMSTTGCGWTSDWSCPGQPQGQRDIADDPSSIGYKCCCDQELWKASTTLQATYWVKNVHVSNGFEMKEDTEAYKLTEKNVTDLRSATCNDYDCPNDIEEVVFIKINLNSTLYNETTCCQAVRKGDQVRLPNSDKLYEVYLPQEVDGDAIRTQVVEVTEAPEIQYIARSDIRLANETLGAKGLAVGDTVWVVSDSKRKDKVGIVQATCTSGYVKVFDDKTEYNFSDLKLVRKAVGVGDFVSVTTSDGKTKTGRIARREMTPLLVYYVTGENFSHDACYYPLIKNFPDTPGETLRTQCQPAVLKRTQEGVKPGNIVHVDRDMVDENGIIEDISEGVVNVKMSKDGEHINFTAGQLEKAEKVDVKFSKLADIGLCVRPDPENEKYMIITNIKEDKQAQKELLRVGWKADKAQLLQEKKTWDDAHSDKDKDDPGDEGENGYCPQTLSKPVTFYKEDVVTLIFDKEKDVGLQLDEKCRVTQVRPNSQAMKKGSEVLLGWKLIVLNHVAGLHDHTGNLTDRCRPDSLLYHADKEIYLRKVQVRIDGQTNLESSGQFQATFKKATTVVTFNATFDEKTLDRNPNPHNIRFDGHRITSIDRSNLTELHVGWKLADTAYQRRRRKTRKEIADKIQGTIYDKFDVTFEKDFAEGDAVVVKSNPEAYNISAGQQLKVLYTSMDGRTEVELLDGSKAPTYYQTVDLQPTRSEAATGDRVDILKADGEINDTVVGTVLRDNVWKVRIEKADLPKDVVKNQANRTFTIPNALGDCTVTWNSTTEDGMINVSMIKDGCYFERYRCKKMNVSDKGDSNDQCPARYCATEEWKGEDVKVHDGVNGSYIGKFEEQVMQVEVYERRRPPKEDITLLSLEADYTLDYDFAINVAPGGEAEMKIKDHFNEIKKKIGDESKLENHLKKKLKEEICQKALISLNSVNVKVAPCACHAGICRPGTDQCERCMPGHHLDKKTRMCNPRTCRCDNGSPVAPGDPRCTERDGQACQDCSYGYHLNNASKCIPNHCYCAYGTPVKPADATCSAEKKESCYDCNSRYSRKPGLRQVPGENQKMLDYYVCKPDPVSYGDMHKFVQDLKGKTDSAKGDIIDKFKDKFEKFLEKTKAQNTKAQKL